MYDLLINQASAMALPPRTAAPVSLFSSFPLSPYHVSCLPLLAVLAVCACNAPALPITSSVLCNVPQRLVQTVDSQRQRKCFYIKASFASRSWCGGGPHATAEGERETGVCRGTTVRLSSTLVLFGRTCILWRNYFINDLLYSSLIFKKNIEAKTRLCRFYFFIFLFFYWTQRFFQFTVMV